MTCVYEKGRKKEYLLNLNNFLFLECIKNNRYAKIENLHPTDDGEPSKKSHGASNC